jgi:hypothetical protein
VVAGELSVAVVGLAWLAVRSPRDPRATVASASTNTTMTAMARFNIQTRRYHGGFGSSSKFRPPRRILPDRVTRPESSRQRGRSRPGPGVGGYRLGMRDDEPPGGYLEAVDRLPALTDRELRELGHAIVEGTAAEQVARKRLIEGHLRMVVAVADEHRDRGRSFGELLEVGNLELVRAVERFDWRRSPELFPRHAAAAVRAAIAAAGGGR